MIRSDINDHLQFVFHHNSSRHAEEMRRHLMLVRTEKVATKNYKTNLNLRVTKLSKHKNRISIGPFV